MSVKNFDALNVPLAERNLVEASAGTGKTFSIAILTLRLILENKIDLSQILMVTFTKAAVAELEIRIRRFVKDAYLYVSEGDNSIDPTIQKIVDVAIQKESKAKVLDRLKGAQFQLDETSIFTIHSFCQKILTEFAFETNQLFANEIRGDIQTQIDKSINEFWRKEITCLPTEHIEHLKNAGLSKQALYQVVQKGMTQKRFLAPENCNYQNIFDSLDKHRQSLQEQTDYFKTVFKNSEEKTHVSQNKNAEKSFGDLLGEPEKFMHTLIQKQSAKYVEKLFPNLLQMALRFDELEKDYRSLAQNALKAFYKDAIEKAKQYTLRYKQKTGILLFDDLIVNLHKAVKGEKSDLLKSELQKKHKAVFVDEFQDTDDLQYEIFDTLFGKSSIVFYIGDPKQAIYSFRGADIETYKSATKKVSQVYTMSQNFRSSKSLVEAMNHFFSIDNPFLDDSILYETVSSGKPLTPPQINGEEVEPLQIFSCSNKETVTKQTAYRILELLKSGIQIEGRDIQPSDIAVLVRTKSQGLDVYNALRKLKVPAVTMDDTKVKETEEAMYIRYLLSALIHPSPSEIKRVLLTPLSNYNKKDVLEYSLEEDIQRFKETYEVWSRKGIYSAINHFFKLYNSKEVIFQKEKRAERIYTNLLQLQELLHQKETEEKLSPEMLSERFLNNTDTEEDDAYTQRIESDEDAVQIVTIHKSKGLAYNIVFAPFLDMSNSPNNFQTSLEFKNDKQESVFTIFPKEEEVKLYKIQTEQENRRLLYVALTRAVYLNYIFKNTSKKAPEEKKTKKPKQDEKNSKIEDVYLYPFLKSQTLNNDLLEEPQALFLSEKQTKNSVPKAFEREEVRKKWGNTSYSSLSDAHFSFDAEPVQLTNAYDTFIFETLGKGASVGNFLHDIFENIDFTEDNHEEAILRIGDKYPNIFQKDLMPDYQKLIQNVLEADYSGFTLKEVNLTQRISELEFYFQISGSEREQINALSPLFKVDSEHIPSGVLYGFIDLFFEHNGQFFILDWKSNFLGYQESSYQNEVLEQAMLGNNYHLQYMLYTVAVKRFLEQKIKGFDYEKHFGGVFYVFLRGCRKQKKSGLFFKKPEYALVKQLDKLL